MKKRSILAILLAALLALVLLAGCGKTPETPAPAPAPEPQPEQFVFTRENFPRPDVSSCHRRHPDIP